MDALSSLVPQGSVNNVNMINDNDDTGYMRFDDAPINERQVHIEDLEESKESPQVLIRPSRSIISSTISHR